MRSDICIGQNFLAQFLHQLLTIYFLGKILYEQYTQIFMPPLKFKTCIGRFSGFRFEDFLEIRLYESKLYETKNYMSRNYTSRNYTSRNYELESYESKLYEMLLSQFK